jgi:phospholipid/cholesterol/gamma-HCH transport system substrate-binding protein
MAEDTEALKHSFFFRGFFRRRGYYNLSNLKPDQYRQDKVFSDPTNHREWFSAQDLFEVGANGVETLSARGRKQIDEATTQLGDAMVSRPVVVEGYASASEHEEQFAKSRNRAILVSQYLHTHFHLEVQNVGIAPLRDLPPPEVHKDSWDGICIVILK